MKCEAMGPLKRKTVFLKKERRKLEKMKALRKNDKHLRQMSNNLGPVDTKFMKNFSLVAVENFNLKYLEEMN